MENIYLAEDGEDAEPHDCGDIVKRLESGALLDDAFAFVEGMKGWRSVREALLWAQAAEFSVDTAEVLSIIQNPGVSSSDAISQIRELLEKNQSLPDFDTDELLTVMVDLNRWVGSSRQEYQDGQTVPVLKQFPAQELCVTGVIRFPRDWEKAWQDAGGQVVDDRYIARKDDAVWTALSDFDVPYPPFSLEKGIGVRDIGRNDAIALGVMGPTDEVLPVEVPPVPPAILLSVHS